MALRKDIVKRVEIPHEEGEWLEVRLLGWRDLDQAKRARQEASFGTLRAMGGDLFKAMQEARSQELQAGAQPDPLNDYDLSTVLNLGIAGWSYDEPVSPANIDLLDEKTAQWAARVILGFQETEVTRKNGFDSSTWPSVAEESHQRSGS